MTKYLNLKKIPVYIVYSLALVFFIAIINSIISLEKEVLRLFSSLTNNIFKIIAFLSIILISYLVLYKVIYYLWKKPLKLTWFLPVIILMVLFCLVSVILIDVDLQHDPRRYYEYALNFSSNWTKLDLGYIYHRRILTYTLPILTLLPKSLISVQIINICMMMTAIVIYSYLFSKEYGVKVAFIFILLLALNPEIYIVNAIASHDIASLFYFALFLLVLQRLNDRFSLFKLIMFLVLGAVLFVVNDIQRSIMIPMILSLLLMLLLSNTITNKFNTSFFVKRISVMVCLSVVFYLGTKKLFEKYTYDDSSNAHLTTLVYSYNDLYSIGDYHSGTENRYNFWPLISEQKANKIVFEKYFGQIVNHPLDYLSFLSRKSANFFSNSFYHYLMDSRIVGKPLSKEIIILLALSFSMKVALYILAALGVFLLFNSNRTSLLSRFHIIYPMVFVPLILLSEVNPTYSLLILPFLSLFAALGLNALFKKKMNNSLLNNSVKQLSGSFIMVGSLVLLFYLGSFIYVKNSSIDIMDFNGSTPIVEGGEVSKNLLSSPYKLEVSSFDTHKKVSLSMNHVANSISFLLRTKSLPDSFLMKLNNEISPYKFSQKDIRENPTENNYYAFEHVFGKSVNEVVITIENCSDFQINQLILE